MALSRIIKEQQIYQKNPPFLKLFEKISFIFPKKLIFATDFKYLVYFGKECHTMKFQNCHHKTRVHKLVAYLAKLTIDEIEYRCLIWHPKSSREALVALVAH